MWEASLFNLALIRHLTICDQFCISLHRIHGSTIVYKAVKPPSTILFLFSNQRICAPFVLFGMELLLQEPHACLGSLCLYCSATGRRLDGLPVFLWMPGSTSTAWLWFPPRCRTTSASGGEGGVWLPTESQHIKLLKLQAVFLVLRHFLSLIRGRCAGENRQLHRYTYINRQGSSQSVVSFKLLSI